MSHEYKRRYLNIQERIDLIKDIQDGKYLVKRSNGKIQKKINKKLFCEPCEIIDVLESIADIKMVGKGAYGKALKICTPKGTECSGKEVLSYSIKEIQFQNAGTYNNLVENPDRYENTEIRMLQFLSAFVLSRATPHINMPIMSFICQPSPHLSDRQRFDLTTKRITVSELADYGNLYTYLSTRLYAWKNYVLGWKVLFFQILSVLAVIHRYYPNFLHNDFKIDNILVRSTYTSLDEDKSHFKYTVNDIDYYIPDIGFQVLLWDFDFSCIAGTIDNDKLIAMIDEDEANLVVHRNQYYDIHMCFGLMHRFWGDSMPSEINDWLEEYLLNEEIASASRDERILEAKEYTTPSKLLRTYFFKQFTEDIPDVTSKLKGTFTGVLEDDVEFDFGDEKNRYTNPKTCQYQAYIFLDPKTASEDEKNEYRNRYKCELASTQSDLIKKISTSMKTDITRWVSDRLNEYTMSSAVSSTEKRLILRSSLELFNSFTEKYNITYGLFYAVVCACMMYASFQHLLSYVHPFNDFQYWYAQPKLNSLSQGEIEDVYKQFTGFIAKYIENV